MIHAPHTSRNQVPGTSTTFSMRYSSSMSLRGDPSVSMRNVSTLRSVPRIVPEMHIRKATAHDAGMPARDGRAETVHHATPARPVRWAAGHAAHGTPGSSLRVSAQATAGSNGSSTATPPAESPAKTACVFGLGPETVRFARYRPRTPRSMSCSDGNSRSPSGDEILESFLPDRRTTQPCDVGCGSEHRPTARRYCASSSRPAASIGRVTITTLHRPRPSPCRVHGPPRKPLPLQRGVPRGRNDLLCLP